MVPGLDTRLRSIAKAIEQVLLPALPAQEKLAREQAEIAVGHLRVLETQWPFVTQMAHRELQLAIGLAETVLAHLPVGSGANLQTALEKSRTADTADFASVEQATAAVGDAIEAILKSGITLDNEVSAAILSHARAQSKLERVWFAASGISDVTGLPSIEAYLKEDTEVLA